MALLTITVLRDRDTGRMTIRVGLSPNEDELPHEHDARHGRLVAALFPTAEVTRERPAREAVVG